MPATPRALLRRLVPAWLREATWPLRDRAARTVQAWWNSLRIVWRLRILGRPLDGLAAYESRIHSQNGEDGVLEAIFAVVGTVDRFFVEIGVEDGKVCNTRRLKSRGWRGLQIDCRPDVPPEILCRKVTVENAAALLTEGGVPREFDLLSIDIDGNDYWVWQALGEFRPRVVVVEYNAVIPLGRPLTVAYDPDFRWDGSEYFGANLTALEALGRKQGYALVGCDEHGVNAFFVRRDLSGRIRLPSLAEAYRPLAAPHAGWPRSSRPWVEIRPV